MPYITMDRRPPIDMGETPKNAGELNYCLTMTILRSRDPVSLPSKIETKCREYLADAELRYQRINDVLGALSGAWREYRRRAKTSPVVKAEVRDMLEAIADKLYRDIAGPYEDKAIAKNGDCYE